MFLNFETNNNLNVQRNRLIFLHAKNRGNKIEKNLDIFQSMGKRGQIFDNILRYTERTVLFVAVKKLLNGVWVWFSQHKLQHNPWEKD